VSRCVLLRVLPYSSINLCGCPHVICKTDWSVQFTNDSLSFMLFACHCSCTNLCYAPLYCYLCTTLAGLWFYAAD
jgi:hypothetical protein